MSHRLRSTQTITRLAICLAVSLSFLYQSHSQEVPEKTEPASQAMQTWKNNKGEEMTAHLLQYNYLDKTVRFAKDDDNLPYEFPLKELDFHSKLKALGHENFFDKTQHSLTSEMGKASVITACLWLIPIGVVAFFAYLFGFLLSARIVMGYDSFWFQLLGYLKTFVISLIFSILSIACIGIFAFLFKENLTKGLSFGNLASLALGLFASILIIISLKKHYEASFLRSLGMFALYGFLGYLFLMIGFAIIGGGVYYSYLQAPDFLDNILTNWVLKPMKLI